jgi:segregation and condensation protein B
MLEDAAPMAAAEQLGQAIIEFDADATVETVIISEGEETAEDPTNEAVEEVTPESEEHSDQTKQ